MVADIIPGNNKLTSADTLYSLAVSITDVVVAESVYCKHDPRAGLKFLDIYKPISCNGR